MPLLTEYYTVRETYLGTFRSSDNRLPNRMKLTLDFLQSLSIEKFLDIGRPDESFAGLVMKTLKKVEVFGADISAKATRLSLDRGVKAVCADLSWLNLPI